jgi:hypothetical protein
VRSAVAANIDEQDAIVHAPQSLALAVVVDFIDVAENSRASSAKRQHLAHERHAVERASLIERPLDFFPGSDFNEIADLERMGRKQAQQSMT